MQATPALRPSTEAEAWDYSVTRSDAIGVGHMRGVRQASPELPATVGIGLPYRTTCELSFLPGRWLKGQLPVTMQTLLCSRIWLRTREEGITLEGLFGEMVLVFLRGTDDDMYVFESHDVHQEGLFPISQDELDEIAERLTFAEKRRSLDSLLAGADLVLIGAPNPGETSTWRAAGRKARCSLVGGEQVWAGGRAEDRIVAHGMHGAMPMGRSLFFLGRTEEGVYETFPLHAGILPLQGDRVPSLGKGIAEADFEIRRIARFLATPDPIAPFPPATIGGVHPAPWRIAKPELSRAWCRNACSTWHRDRGSRPSIPCRIGCW